MTTAPIFTFGPFCRTLPARGGIACNLRGRDPLLLEVQSVLLQRVSALVRRQSGQVGYLICSAGLSSPIYRMTLPLAGMRTPLAGTGR